MIPKPTPQTATRKTRSQSPPRLTQRTPVSQMQAAMPSSSINPYIRIDSGPRWTTPVCGEGILRSSTVRFCPQRGQAVRGNALQQDLERQLGRAAATHEIDRAVQVDVEPRAERLRSVGLVACPFELGDPPPLDLRQLAVLNQFSRSHVWPSFSSTPYGRSYGIPR